MKLSRQEAAVILEEVRSWIKSTVTFDDGYIEAIDSAIQCMGETKLKHYSKDGFLFQSYNITECCKIGPITTEKFCPECGKKIIK